MHLLLMLCVAAAFDVASVKESAVQQGVDDRGRLVVSTGRVSGRNVTLQDLIAAAYHIQLSQVIGAVKWLDSDEFDIDARGVGDAREMLQALLVECFHLESSRETKERQVYTLSVAPGGVRFVAGKGAEHFHLTMSRFADLLALQATIPGTVDPAHPVVASREPVLVIDKTGLDGVFDFGVDLSAELGTDRFSGWQRSLNEQLGLRLASQKARVDILIVKRADRTPGAN